MSMKMKCIIVDDEPIARDYLSDYVQKMPQLELIGVYGRALDAYPIVEEGSVDILFLDIQMPGITGLDFLRTLQKKPAVILTTAYSEYAIEGFELEVTDYLLKPISFDRFTIAVKKVEKMHQANIVSNANAVNDPQMNLSINKDFIFVKSGYKSVKVSLNDVLYIEGLKEYVVIHTKDKKYTKLDRMKNLEQNLSGMGFLRIHKSYIVSITSINAVFGNTIEISEGIKLPMGRIYKKEIEKVLGMND